MKREKSFSLVSLYIYICKYLMIKHKNMKNYDGEFNMKTFTFGMENDA